MVGRYIRKQFFGETFRWRVEDAREVAKNAIWLHYDYDNPELKSRRSDAVLALGIAPQLTMDATRAADNEPASELRCYPA